mmetsp:Transcript_1693/g.2372  ORF Transcript_1693/g.2372 Transcript_1693/m.2372 type:complete len:83 (+) Transcript_1693:938-1186(+)
MKNQIKKFIKRKNLFSIFYKQVNTKHILFTEYKIHKVFSSEKLYDLLSNKISFNYGIKEVNAILRKNLSSVNPVSLSILLYR